MSSTYWVKYIKNPDLRQSFTEIWGDEPLPREFKIRQLEKCSDTVSRIKWLSQQLYARRLSRFSKKITTLKEFEAESIQEKTKLRECIAQVMSDNTNIKTLQDKILFDCGTRGSLEIRLFRGFKRHSSRFSYMDKNYNDEIEDLEAGLGFSPLEKIKGCWEDVNETFYSIFTTENIAIFGITKLLEYNFLRFSEILSWNGKASSRSSGGVPMALHFRGSFVNDCYFFQMTTEIENRLKRLVLDFKEMIEEKCGFTCSDIPYGSGCDKSFEKWFDNIFVRGGVEFTNVFEAVWLLLEVNKKGVSELRNLICKIAKKTLPEHCGEATASQSSTPCIHRSESIYRIGEKTIQRSFCTSMNSVDVSNVTTMFAKRWKTLTTKGVLRKNVCRFS